MLLSLLNLILQLYLIILIVRLLLEWSGASGRNPLCRWLVKLTQPILNPLQRFLPSKGNINWSCLLVAIIVDILQLLCLSWAQMNALPQVGGLLIAALGNLLYLTATIFFWGIIANAILSWVTAMNHTFSPLQEVLYYLTRPLLKPAQKIIPPIGGIDLSPIPVLLLLQLFKGFVATPLIVSGFGMVL